MAKGNADSDTAMEGTASSSSSNWEIIAMILTTVALLVAIFCVVNAAGAYGGLGGQ